MSFQDVTIWFITIKVSKYDCVFSANVILKADSSLLITGGFCKLGVLSKVGGGLVS